MEKGRQYNVIKIGTTVCRFVLALVFIFSGFVKAIDPLGTLYKIQDYVNALRWMDFVPDFLLNVTSFGIGILEFCLGIYLFFGIRRIIAPYIVFFVMLLMTPLTFWIALYNPVSDCGCFGDAIILGNWETFWKNVVLLFMSLVVVKWRRCVFPLVTTRLDWMVSIYGFLYIFILEIYCYINLPIFDFRPYYVGADIVKGMNIPEGEKPTEYETLFILRKNGEEREFTLDNYPDSTWTFVDSYTVVKEPGYEPPIQNFSILRLEDEEDITEQILNDDNYTFILVSNQISMADDGAIDLINELYDYSLEYNYKFYFLTSSSEEDIKKWKEDTGAEYPFCVVDNITLKTMIRSNPGVMLLKKGVVLQKWSISNIPDEYELTGPLDELPIGINESKSLIYKIILVLSWFVFPLLLICMLDLVFKSYLDQRNKLGDD